MLAYTSAAAVKAVDTRNKKKAQQGKA